VIGVNDRGKHPGDLWQVSRQRIRQKINRKLGPKCVLVERRCGVLEFLKYERTLFEKMFKIFWSGDE